MELAVGTPVDKFIVEGLLGTGGMASVYRIRHRDLNVSYALKVMHVTHPELAGRIKSEGMLQAELRHANIVTVLDIVDVGGSPGLVMEFVEGPSLAGLLETYRPTLDQIDDIARGILKGVRAAHAKGMIHRDLKPANVMLATTEDGYVPKITDFGLAKSLAGSQAMNQTRTGAVMGTPAYMAPEQFRNTRGVDARADVYSLGVVLYELCTGQRPYDAEDLFEMLDRVRKADYPRVAELFPSIPDRMADAIDGAMVVTADERIPDADTLYQVWCGRVQLDRSRIWDRASMKRIGDTLSSGADGPPSSPSMVSQGRSARAASASALPPVSGGAGAEPKPEPVRTDDVSLARVPVVATEPAAAAEPAVATEPVRAAEPVSAAEPEKAAEPVSAAEPASAATAAVAAGEPGSLEDDEAGPPDDHTRFERRLSPQILAELDDPPAAEPAARSTEAAPVAAPVEAPRADAARVQPAAPPVSVGVLPPAPPPVSASVVPREQEPSAERFSSTTSGVRSGTAPSATDPSPSLNLPAPPPARRGLGVPILGAAVVVLVLGGGAAALLAVLGVGTLGWFLQPGGGDDLNLPPIEVPAEVARPLPPEPANPEAPAPDDTPEGTEPDETEPDGTAPEETPEQTTPGAPDETAPREVAPAPKPRPAPSPSKGRVELTGDATAIRLISASGASFGAGAVPEGTYSLKATFPGQGELDQTAKVVVAKGQKVVVHCRSGFYSCTAR